MKIRCNTCDSLNDRKCIIIGKNVSPNKSRICEHYSYDDTKVKIKQKLPTISASINSIGKSKVKQTNRQPIKSYTINSIKHPLTGDLSRFTSTTKKGD